MKIKECQLQALIVQYFRLKGIFVFSVPNGFWCGFKNKIAIYKYINKLKREGFKKGVSDLIVLLPKAITLFLELKVNDNKQSPEQKQFEKDVKSLGFDYHLIRNWEDVEKLGL